MRLMAIFMTIIVFLFLLLLVLSEVDAAGCEDAEIPEINGAYYMGNLVVCCAEVCGIDPESTDPATKEEMDCAIDCISDVIDKRLKNE